MYRTLYSELLKVNDFPSVPTHKIVIHTSTFNDMVFTVYRVGVRVGTAVQPAALPVGSGTCRPSPLTEANRDSGEDMVPEQAVQDQTQAAASTVWGWWRWRR